MVSRQAMTPCWRLEAAHSCIALPWQAGIHWPLPPGSPCWCRDRAAALPHTFVAAAVFPHDGRHSCCRRCAPVAGAGQQAPFAFDMSSLPTWSESCSHCPPEHHKWPVCCGVCHFAGRLTCDSLYPGGGAGKRVPASGRRPDTRAWCRCVLLSQPCLLHFTLQARTGL